MADRRRRRELSVQLHEIDQRLRDLDPFERPVVERRYDLVKAELDRVDSRILSTEGRREVTAWQSPTIVAECHSVQARLSVPVTIDRRGERTVRTRIDRALDESDIAITPDPDRGLAGEVASLPSESRCQDILNREVSCELRELFKEEELGIAERCLVIAAEHVEQGEVAEAVELLVRLLINETLTISERVAVEVRLLEWSRRSPAALAGLAQRSPDSSGNP